MIFISNNSQLIVPKVNRCKSGYCNIYQIVLQNKATKEIIIYKVRDYSSGNPVHYLFNFLVPDWLEYGEYDFYLLPDSDWFNEEIDQDNPSTSVRSVDKGGITANGRFLVSGNTLIVTSNVKAKMYDHTGQVVSGKKGYLVTAQARDTDPCGDICKGIEIIHTDLLKYKPENEPYYAEPKGISSRKQYKEYKRDGRS